MSWNYREAEIGDELPSLSLEPISRSNMILYAQVSGDHNPIHTDKDFAVKSGLPDVIAHGMLIMAYLGRMLTDIVPQSKIENINVQFSNMTHLHDELKCIGKVVEKNFSTEINTILVSLRVEEIRGQKKILGQALININ